jgi:diguanylate cyclase (GGDEF)-like protein
MGLAIIKILLVEDNPDDLCILNKMFAHNTSVNFMLTNVGQLNEAIKRLDEECYDVVLLDLNLPDSRGLDTFFKVHAQASEVPIVILTGLNDETQAVEAVRKGAQDYLVKGQVNDHLLVRAIHYAIERHQMMTMLRSQALIDELTGLYNRRGFLSLAEQYLKLAHRTKKKLLLFLADLDGLKQINDEFGHPEGDQALLNSASLLRETFHSSNIIARIGGDEFVVLTIEIPQDNTETLTTRLRNNVDIYNAKSHNRYKLSLSVGIADGHPECASSVDELLAQADSLMYQQKKGKSISYIIKNQESPRLKIEPRRNLSDKQEKSVMADKKILIIDDNDDDRLILRKFLQESGYKSFLFTHNGEEGLKMASRETPDLIISDVMMPQMTGYQLCQKLKENPRTEKIPVILLTSLNQGVNELQGFESETDVYITKPFDRILLTRAVTRLLEGRQQTL